MYGDKAKDLDMANFIVVKNMHEPIVSEEIFYKVQQITEKFYCCKKYARTNSK